MLQFCVVRVTLMASDLFLYDLTFFKITFAFISVYQSYFAHSLANRHLVYIFRCFFAYSLWSQFTHFLGKINFAQNLSFCTSVTHKHIQIHYGISPVEHFMENLIYIFELHFFALNNKPCMLVFLVIKYPIWSNLCGDI